MSSRGLTTGSKKNNLISHF
ncbi:MAG: palindromic element RPE4 domain-containing protein [Rickettsia endosymbiont of Haemaphysalis japonica]